MTDVPEYGFNVWDQEVKADPYPHYEAMRSLGRVIANPFLAGQLMVVGYDDVVALLGDAETYGNSGLGGGGQALGLLQAPTVLTTDPPDHQRLRSVVSRAFTPRSIVALEAGLTEIARDLVAPLADGEPYDVVTQLAEPLPALAIAQLLGVGRADLDDFVEWSHGLMGGLDLFGSPHKLRHAQECSKALHDYFAVEVERRRRHPSDDDLVGRLVAANDDGRLSDAEVLASCVILLIGGHETTTKLITNAVLTLHRHPDERARLVDDGSLLPTAVDEVARFDTAVQGNVRVAKRPSVLAGVDVPTGSLVIGLLAAANRDPAHFTEPQRFDVGRSPNPHIAFGRGIHFCLGASLARLEAQIALRELLGAAPRYDRTEPELLEYGPTFFFHAPVRLQIAA